MSKLGGGGVASTTLVATTPSVVHTTSSAASVGTPPAAFNAPAPAPNKLNNKNRNQRNNHNMPSLPTPMHPWNDKLQLWAGAAVTRSGGPWVPSTMVTPPQVMVRLP
jgi:hypothetical protein